jgi:hypothetical protein
MTDRAPSDSENPDHTVDAEPMTSPIGERPGADKLSSELKLYGGLLIGLALFAAITLALSGRFDRVSFWTNLSTELIGAVITVAFIGYILSRIETQRTAQDQKRIERALGELAFEFVNQVSEQLGLRELLQKSGQFKDIPIARLAEYAIGIEPNSIISELRALREPKLVSLADYMGSFGRRWQVFYDRNSSHLAQEYSAEMLRLSQKFGPARQNILEFSQIEVEVERNYQGDHTDMMPAADISSEINERQSLESMVLGYDILKLMIECVGLAIRTGHINGYLWSIDAVDRALEEYIG